MAEPWDLTILRKQRCAEEPLRDQEGAGSQAGGKPGESGCWKSEGASVSREVRGMFPVMLLQS